MNKKFENRLIYDLYNQYVLVIPNLTGRWAYYGKLLDVRHGMIQLGDARIMMDTSTMMPEPCGARRQIIIDADTVESIILPAVV